MRVYLRVFMFIMFVGSGLSFAGNELFAQNTNLAPTSTNGEYTNSAQDSYVCSDKEIQSTGPIESEPAPASSAQINACSADYQSEPDVVSSLNTPEKSDKTVNENGEQISLLPNPEVEFVEEYMVKFDSFKSRDTIIYGGVVPFVAIPDTELANEDKFFNEDSFSVFLYFKRKF